jgi:hypothetical protein
MVPEMVLPFATSAEVAGTGVFFFRECQWICVIPRLLRVLLDYVAVLHPIDVISREKKFQLLELMFFKRTVRITISNTNL